MTDEQSKPTPSPSGAQSAPETPKTEGERTTGERDKQSLSIRDQIKELAVAKYGQDSQDVALFMKAAEKAAALANERGMQPKQAVVDRAKEQSLAQEKNRARDRDEEDRGR